MSYFDLNVSLHTSDVFFIALNLFEKNVLH